MTAAEYKRVCQQSDVFPRSIIAAAARSLPANSELTVKLKTLLAQEPVDKPTLHQEIENHWADYFRVELSQAEVDEILDTLISAEAEAVSPTGETTPQASLIAGWVDLWARFRESQEDKNEE